MMKRFRGCLGVLLIFLFGFICGAVISAGSLQHQFKAFLVGGVGKEADPVVVYFRKELKLSPQQEDGVREIVVGARGQLNAIRIQAQPGVEAAVADAEGKVRALLDEKQAAKFDAIMSKNHAKWKATESGGS